MHIFIVCVLAFLLPFAGKAGVVFSQPPNPAGGVYTSSEVTPNGSNADIFSYDDFTLTTTQVITEITWRGGYSYNAQYGHVTDFTIMFYATRNGVSEPNCSNPDTDETIYLARYSVGGIAGETPAGTFGGVAMYDYHYTLPQAFQAVANTKYWIKIEAAQPSVPDWGMAVGTGGDNRHFQFSTGAAQFTARSNDLTFSLLSSNAQAYTITTSSLPIDSGTTAGDGAYPTGTTATVTASPLPGFGFVKWTENNTTVSSSPSYTFTVTRDRALVAHFTPAYTITTSPSIGYGGKTSGDGTYNSGSNVTVTATPGPGHVFVNWTEYGTPVSTAARYTFTAAADRTLVANFALNSASTVFDFDTGTPTLHPGQTATPMTQTKDGITAQFSSPTPGAGGFSVQSDATTQYRLSQFYDNYLYPNSVFNPALDIQFNRQLTGISLTFATADFHQTELTTLVKVTAYLDSTSNAPVGSATARGIYSTDTMPMGTLTLNTTQPFNVVEITIPYAPQAASDFFVDNIIVTATTPLANHQTDLWIRKTYDTAYSGDNIINTTGVGQTRGTYANPFLQGQFIFRIQNDGDTTDSFSITAPPAPVGWVTKYYRSPSNEEITAPVTGSGWTTPALAPGASECFYLMTRPLQYVPINTVLTRYITADSIANPARVDVVKTMTVVNAGYQPDLWLRTASETVYTGDNTYNTTAAGQTKSQTKTANVAATYLFRVQNDGNTADNITLTAPAAPAGWTVQYYDSATNADITSQVTGTGWTTPTLARGTHVGLYVKVTPLSTVTAGGTQTVTLTAVSTHNVVSKDVVKCVTTKQ